MLTINAAPHLNGPTMVTFGADSTPANPVELGMARSLLNEAGIPHVVHGTDTSSLLTAHMGAGFGGLQSIVVRRVDEERARKIFDEAWGAEDEGDPTGDA